MSFSPQPTSARAPAHRRPWSASLAPACALAALLLAGCAVVLSALIAVPLGLLAAYRRDKVADIIAQLIALAGAAAPGFWIAFVLVYFFACIIGYLHRPIAAPHKIFEEHANQVRIALLCKINCITHCTVGKIKAVESRNKFFHA